MTALLTALAAKAGTYLVGAAVVVAAFVATYLRGRSSGKATAETQQKAKEADAYEQHLKELAAAANARPSGSVSDDPNNRDRR